ncbi:7091_t:CDS:10 [Acaulospora colombiana]|uniref:7091_t:CDS:1 n=1 Tax=Acaulospora colombiana TaxID=27376 RepID=A0ACA9L2G4_9GLOM|nr:7091_t:CDS:10 [Acaulospora colombiana]
MKERKGTRGQSVVQAPYETGKRVNQAKAKLNSKKEYTSRASNDKGIVSLDKFHEDFLESVKNREVEITRISGGCLNKLPGVFSIDSKYIFCACSNVIKVYSVATGDVVRIISESPEKNGHKDEITCIMLNPNDSSQVYELGIPIYRMMILASYPDQFFVVTGEPRVSLEKERKASGHQMSQKYVLLHFKFDSRDGQPKTQIICKSGYSCTGLDASADGEFLVVTFIQIIRVIKVKSIQDSNRPKWPKYCLSENQIQDPVTSTVHWHAHKVNHITFTNDGSYLLSGGEEAVLVIWQVETGYTTFLPRLGSEILFITISPDQTLYAISFTDNSIKIYSAINLEIKQAIQGLKYAQLNSTKNLLSTGLVIEPRNHYVVLNGNPGAIQFYNAYTDRNVMEFEVSSRILVSRAFQKEMIYHHVCHVAFSLNGSWMVDSRDDHETTPELYLKFWRFDSSLQTYVLNTRVDHPHSKPIVSLNCHRGSSDSSPVFVTTGLDNKFKVWRISAENDSKTSERRIVWSCTFVGSYRQYTPGTAAFSHDGSILAIAYGSIVTLWDSRLNVLNRVLPNNEPVKHIVFTNNAPFLVTTTRSHLYVWNLLTCTIWWSYRLEVHHLVADPENSSFAVASNNEKLLECTFLIFDPKNYIPIVIHKIKDFVEAMAYLPKRPDSIDSSSNPLLSQIIYLNQKYDMLSIEDKGPQ